MRNRAQISALICMSLGKICIFSLVSSMLAPLSRPLDSTGGQSDGHKHTASYPKLSRLKSLSSSSRRQPRSCCSTDRKLATHPPSWLTAHSCRGQINHRPNNDRPSSSSGPKRANCAPEISRVQCNVLVSRQLILLAVWLAGYLAS